MAIQSPSIHNWDLPSPSNRHEHECQQNIQGDSLCWNNSQSTVLVLDRKHNVLNTSPIFLREMESRARSYWIEVDGIGSVIYWIVFNWQKSPKKSTRIHRGLSLDIMTSRRQLHFLYSKVLSISNLTSFL